MEDTVYKEPLREFMGGRLSLKQLREFIDDRLFELRQTPDMTEERELLSYLELIIHECSEGLRSDVELFERIRLVILPGVVSTVDISPRTYTATHTVNLTAAPVTEYRCPDRVLA